MAALEWLRPMLSRIEQTNAPRPMDGTVVDMPGGLDKLRKAILAVQRERDNATQQADDYEKAWAAAQMEYQAAVEKNRVWQTDIQARLYKLQCEWSAVTEPLGMTVQIERAK